MALCAALCAAGCASDRYIGSIGRDGAYVNRGYGFTLLLNTLEDRWSVPAQVNGFDSPIDVDGDGKISIDENRRIRRPTLRLESKTSSASVAIDVLIFGKNNKDVPLEDLAHLELAKLTATSSIALETLTIGTFPARIAQLPNLRYAMIDVQDFSAEENQTRRQVFTVVMRAQEMSDALKKDFEVLLSALVLNRRAGAETAQEKW